MMFEKVTLAGPKGENQDAILEPFIVGASTWCAIADGVGSSDQGGLAARACIEEVGRVVSSESMESVFSRVSDKLNEIAAGSEGLDRLSTTLSVLEFHDSSAHIGHVGDTRITHYRGGGVMTRTRDQTEVQKLLDDGVISKNQARRYPRKNVLLSAMSAGREYDLYQSDFQLLPGDRLLLTTDGFHSKLLRPQVAELSARTKDFRVFWKEVSALLDGVSLEDDASCLAIEVA